MLKLNTKSKLKQRRLFFDKDNPGLKKIIKILALTIATSWIYLEESIDEQQQSEKMVGIYDVSNSDHKTFKSMMIHQELMVQSQNEYFENSSQMLRCQRIRTRKDKFQKTDKIGIVNIEKIRPQRTWLSRLLHVASAQQLIKKRGIFQELEPSNINLQGDQYEDGSNATNQVIMNAETFNTQNDEKRVLQFVPTINSNLFMTYPSPPYCSIVIQWSVTFPSGTTTYTELDILSYGSSTAWNGLNPGVYNQANLATFTIPYSTLSNYGYFPGSQFTFRIRFRNSHYPSFPATYYQTTFPRVIQTAPTAPLSISFSQTMYTFTISWPALATSWTSNTSPVGTGNPQSAVTYTVQRSSTLAGTYADIPVTATTTETSITFSLPNTANYQYASTWYYKVGSNTNCVPVVIYQSTGTPYTMLGGNPVAPNTPALSSNFDAIIRIDWNQLTTITEINHSDIKWYRVYYRYSQSNTPLFLAVTPNPSTTYWEQFGGKSPLNYMWGQTVYFSVSAVNQYGEGTKSGDLPVDMPRVPQVQPTLTLVAKTMTKLDFSWTGITNDIDKGLLSISGYQLEGNTNSLFTGTTILNTTLVSSARTYSFLRASFTYLANTNYYFRVYGVNAAGFGASASMTTVLTPTVPIKMAAPTVSTINPLNIVINWVALTTLNDIGYESITNYYIQRCVGATCTTSFISYGFDSTTLTFNETFTQAQAIAQQGQVWRYQVFACNFNGNGTASDYLTITVDNVPQLMSTVTLTCVEVLPFSMKFSWTALSSTYDGGNPVTFYGLEYSVGGSTFSQLNSDFSNLYYAYTYSVSVAYIPSTVYSFRLKAKNGVDYSNTFATTTCTSLSVPTGMTALSYGAVNPKSIVVNWNELTDMNMNGRDNPIFYQLEWYNSEVSPARWDILTFQNVHGKVLTFTHTRTTVFPSASTQLYRVVAQNNMGIGGSTAYSSTLSVPADEIPIRMNNPTLVGVTPNSFSLTWSPISLPADTGRDDVIYYHVKWLPTGGTAYQVLTNYPTSTTILTSYTHTLSSGIFLSGTKQNYQICAQNGVGEGACGTIEVEADKIPQSCNSPTIAIADIHPQKVTINWAPIDSTLNGGDVVVFYLLEWNQGPTINTYVPLNSYTSGMAIPVQLVHTPSAILTSGAAYKYRVSALNGVGYGPTCEQTMYADLVPQVCSTPDVSIASIKPQQTTVTWPTIDPLQNGGDAVIFYLLEWNQGLGSGSESNFIPLNTYTSGMTVPTSQVHNTPSILTSGAPYIYRLTPKNGVGYSLRKCSYTMYADKVPQACTNPIITLDDIMPSQITINWLNIAEADNGGDAVVFYELSWDSGTNEGQFFPLNTYTTGMAVPTKHVHNPGYILTTGAPYTYRIRALNGVGYSELYCKLQINADQVPLACTDPIIPESSIWPQKVSITWNNIDVAKNGGDPVIYYQLEWDQGSGAWENLNSYTANMAVPLSYVHNTPSILKSGEPYVYRLTAKNGVDFSTFQCTTTIKADLVPQACTSPIIPLTSIYPKNVQITWDKIADADNGRDPVIFYLLEWDQGKSEWEPLNAYTTNMVVPTSYNHIPPAILDSGGTYVYKLTPKNGVDYSTFECTTTIYADLVPQKCNPPVILEADVKPQQVKINWVDISVDDNGRDPIIFYLLEWDQGNNDWVALNSYTANMAVPLSKVHTPAAILTSGMTIKYRLTAKNGVAYGAMSTETPVLCDAVPKKMDVPMVSMIRYNYISIYWTLLTTDDEIGRDPILYYRLEFFDRPCYTANSVVACTTTFDAADGTWTDLIPTVTTITNAKTHSATTIFSAGKTFNYRVRAKNGVGWGEYSDILDVLTPVKPQFMNKPRCDFINPQAIKISWDLFTNTTSDFENNQGRDIITYYTIEVDPDTGTFQTLNPTGSIISTITHTSPSAPFKNGTIFKYRVAATNGMGMGAYSEELLITTDTVPEEVQNLMKVSVEPKIIKVKWDDLITDTQIGRDNIKYYKLEYHDNQASTLVWTTLTSSSVAYVTEYTHTVASPFPANQDQTPHYVKYRVSATNGVGYGITTELYVLTDTYPRQMSKVSIADPTASLLDITWTQLSTDDIDTGRDPVIHYKVQWIVSSFTSNNWQTLNTYPDLSDNVKVTDSNSYWQDNSEFKVRVAAQNGVGLGIYSDYELVLTDDVPNRLKRMKVPVENPQTNATQIMIDWEDLTDPLDTGRDPVTYYRVYWDQGKNVWAEQSVPGNARVTTFLWNSAIKNGTTYKFKIRPQNLVGDSSSFDSPIVSIIPSSPPDKMDKITISLITTDVSVKFAWNYPQDNGDSVDEYLIEIRGKDNEFYPYLTTCDGSITSIVSSRFCYIYMDVLRNDPYNLVKGDKIVARGNSRNLKGWNVTTSDAIDSQFTTVIEVEPNAPSAPVRGSNTDFNTLHITWASISDFSVASGGTTTRITSYQIQRNLGNSSISDPDLDTWITLQGFSSNTTLTSVSTTSSIVGGTTYRTRVRAYNKFGWGPWSAVTEIIAAKAPDATTWITTTNSSTNFYIKWQEPFNRGLSIFRYYITIMKKGGTSTNAAHYFASPDCNGADITINTTQSCSIPMANLRGSPWFWGLNDKLTMRIWAETPMGQGSQYQIISTTSGNNAAIQTQPQTPTTFVTNTLAITTDLKMKISWAALPTVDSWGGIQITTYEIYWMDPNNDYDLLYTDTPPFKFTYLHTKTDPLDFSVTPARHIVPGTLYKFKYRAINIHGIGSFSGEASHYASTIPDKLAAPVTSLYNTTVTIVWAVTPNDHAQAVSKYAIRFRTSGGSYIEDSGCPGANPTVVSSLSCTMPMTKFTSAPFNLGIDTLIQATVDAYNVMGWSGQSNPNTIGVLAKRLPQAAPTNLARGVNTGKNQIHLTWVGLSTNAQTGGQNVDYRIYYDRATNQASWSVLVTSTNNATVYQELNSVIYKTGNLYSFRVQAWNDFGLGAQNSTVFGIWTAIPPTGLAAPTSSLAYNSYTEEDDIIVIDWEPPTDNGGLAVSYQVDIRAKSGSFLAVSMLTECYENNNGVTDYKMPSIPTADLGTRCTVVITNLKSKYSLLVGDTVVARVTASHVVGSVTSNAGGTAILPIVSCFRTTFPRVVGGSNSDTMITCMDTDDTGQIVIGGHTQDRNLLEGKTLSYSLPLAVYIAKGNFYAWAKYLQTTDTSSSAEFTTVSDITFRWDGEKVAIALDRANYEVSYVIVVLNKDGTLYGAYRENTVLRGKVFTGGMIFDSSNMITVALDTAPTGLTNRRQAVINRFPVTQTSAGTFITSIYMVGGTNTAMMISQSFALLRIRGDASQFYLSALITDSGGIRRSLLAKALFGTGVFQKYFVQAAGTDYNSDSSVAVIKRMSLEENDLTGQHLISACIMSQDNYRIHFGEFIFNGVGSQSQTVLTPSSLAVYNTYNCLGTFSRVQGTLYFLYNYRSDANPVNHRLILGRVTVSTKKLDELNIVSHDGPNQYGGAKFVHMSRIYYYGWSNKIYNGNTQTNQPMNQGWINIFDPLEQTYSCNPTTQTFNIPSTQISLDQVLVAQMDWKFSGLTSTSGFANSVNRTMRSMGTITGLNNLNLAEPLTNNTWCPIVTTGGGAPTITSPSIPNQVFQYNPDFSGSQTQSFQFNPITVSRFCPDTVIYNYTYLSATNKALPSFITLKGDNNSYVYDVSSTSHVGTYFVMLMSALGNNKSSSVIFRSQVVSPCINNPVAIPNDPIPIYDISEWSPKYFDLNWIVTNATKSCGSVYQIFELLNYTTGGPIDPNIYQVVNQSSGIQRIQIWTQSIPYAKLWTDLLVNSYLQGDFVASKVFTVNITNDCAPTVITPQVMPNWVYYTGRDSIDLTFVWSETIGKCGPISYTLRDYQITNPSSNNTLDPTIFTSPSVAGTNNTLKIFTADEAQVGTYRIRVFASLGVGGYKQSETVFTLQIIRDPCAYYAFSVPFIDDLTLWINQTDQVIQIPYFKMSDPAWICNFTYVFTTPLNSALDPMFVKQEVVKQGTNPNITLVSTDKTKVELSPYTIKIKGWPTRQPSSVALSFTFRVFIAYFDKRDCQPGKFYNENTEQCESCTSPCSQCKTNPTTCTWCIDEYIYVDSTNQCIAKTASCPTGVKDPYLSICRKCSEFCKTCDDYNTCTQCIPNYSLANKKCYPPRSCPEGYTYNGNDCTKCSANCASCVSSTQCNYCMETFYLDTTSNVCVSTCPVGYYADKESRVCMVCAPQCKTCVNNNYTCTSCKDLVVGGVTTYTYLFGSACVDRCPYLQYFQNHPNRSCDACDPQCKICVNAINDCIVCNDKSVISGRSCLNSCPMKSYITEIGTCFPCDASCDNCTGAMNSMCSKCSTGNYLTQTTCDSKCNPPLYADISTGSCLLCPYYCNQCTMATDCQKCKTGYRQVPNSCEGEMFARFNGSVQLNMTMDSALMSFNPTEMTVELWFKIDNPLTSSVDIILGASPYKLKKKPNVAQVQLSFEALSYCDSFNLKANQWYHYAFALSEATATLNCYLTGEKLNTGLNSVSLITADILAFRELTFGGSQELKPAENRFKGYIKEFRWWKVARSYFQINNFKDISIATPPPEMLAYWRLDEYRTNNTAWRDSAKGSVTTPTAPWTLAMIMELREIYLKICPEGTFGVFNDSSNMAECIPCHPNCKNCNGLTNTSCTDCTSQFRLIEAEQTCIPDGPCPNGYYSDVNRKCQPCHPYCETCEFTPTQCPKCKPKYFKQGFGCLDKCLRGLYGNYQTQSCDPNPLVTSMFPLDGTVYQYGSFIDLFATFEVLNGENKTTYTYGWIISQLSTDVDLAKDAAKPYFDTDITRVHLDNNILVPNKYYNITFYVRGKDAYYNGMAASMYNIIFIGIPPKNGRCVISPSQGIASVTTFTISSVEWNDGDDGGIAEYSFFYSLDKGDSYVPIKTANSRLPSLQMIFDPIFVSMTAQIKCQAKSIKGFSAYTENSFILLKKSSASSKAELAKVNVSKVTDEKDAVKLSSQILQIAQDLGQIKPVDTQAFDSKITADKCTQATCSYSGQCIFNDFNKKYYCKCNPGYAGVNCTYKNATDLQMIRNQTLALCKLYNPMSLSGRNSYDYQFLDMVTTNVDLMTEDIHDAIFDILSVQVNKLVDSRPNIGDNKDITQNMNIISNMLEFQAHNNFIMNMTNGWKNVSDPDAKSQKMLEDLNKTVSLVNLIKNLTLKRLSYLQTEIKVQTRMISFRQVLQNSDSILSMPATDNIKKQQQTYVKISPSNFIGSSVSLGEKFIAEVTEFAMNPYQVNNTDNVAANILEVNLFNYNRTVDGGSIINKTDVKNLPVPIEFSFPVSDNQNLTDFINSYNTLNNFKYSDVIKKDQMLRKSNLSCVYWDKVNKTWSKEGCQLQGVDKNHIKCNCTHLSSFTILFATPKLTIDAPLLENTTISAASEVRRNVSLSDIIKWPLSAYFSNLKKLWQHNRPSFISFLINPGFAVLILFWAMYFSSLIYYSGQDDLKRFKMTKQQNRDDLAEVNDNDVQNVDIVVKDLIVKDFLKENGKFIKKEALRLNQPGLIHKPSRPPQIKIYEKLSKDEQKQYRKRARKKVFGMPSGLCARAKRIYDITMKHNNKNPNAKMSFFNEVLKNNLWIGLIAKTSKIAPRHVRLLLMYFYSALHITLLTIIFAFQLQEIISDSALFQVVVIGAALIPVVWIITIPVALILRMPLHLRQLMAGVRTKKINKAFQIVDQHMGWRYAVGYFICITMFFIMTLVVLVFNIFYPRDYVMGWFFNVLLVYIFDLLVFTFMLAAFQMVMIILSTKAKCFYHIWAAIEVFRYVKNLRG